MGSKSWTSLYFLIEHDYCVSKGHGSGGKCQLYSSMVKARRGRSGVEGGQMGKKGDECNINNNKDKCD